MTQGMLFCWCVYISQTYSIPNLNDKITQNSHLQSSSKAYKHNYEALKDLLNYVFLDVKKFISSFGAKSAYLCILVLKVYL